MQVTAASPPPLSILAARGLTALMLPKRDNNSVKRPSFSLLAGREWWCPEPTRATSTTRLSTSASLLLSLR
ncbi:hypothetical protein E2C01_102376 [Portunus trituberculatus]|uniref:Uncharacterized protein n=1 Tax=Portunus trituberculatus TaxID=210409 RepID=A0A5B7KH56_PORTR|nr:hypothetical protein [Portunus trituberculatus]